VCLDCCVLPSLVHGGVACERGFSGRDAVLTWSRDSIFEAELQDVIPICHATIAGTRIVGRLTAGYVRTKLHDGGMVNLRKAHELTV
jgi:hypothetical protein